MKLKNLQRIVDETPQEIKDKVSKHMDELDKQERERNEAERWKHIIKAIEEVGFWVFMSIVFYCILK